MTWRWTQISVITRNNLIFLRANNVLGLNLEEVAGVDQEAPPAEGGAEAGFEGTTELVK